MSLIPWKSKEVSASPTGTVERSVSLLRDEMESLFDRFLSDRWVFGPQATDLFRWSDPLRIDVSETDDDVTIKLEAPGVAPEDLDVNVAGQMLTIRGEKRQEQEDCKRNYHYVERRFGSFQRTIPLPAGVDADHVSATAHNGVITIQMPKLPDAKPKRIPVKKS